LLHKHFSKDKIHLEKSSTRANCIHKFFLAKFYLNVFTFYGKFKEKHLLEWAKSRGRWWNSTGKQG